MKGSLKYKITAFLTEDMRHCPYILKGLLDLEKGGIINLKFKSSTFLYKNRWLQNGSKGFRTRKGYPWFVELNVTEISTKKQIKIGLDLQDWNNMFSYHSIQKCDIIYKRALVENEIGILSEALNMPIKALGPNHSVMFSDKRIDKIIQQNKWKQTISKIFSEPKRAFRMLKSKFVLKKKQQIEKTKNKIEYSKIELPKTPYIFFQVQYHNWKDNQYSKGLNEMRADLIRTLRKEFANNFVGGMFGDIDENFKDCITDVNPTPENYKRFVENATVLISTNGFGDSIPWKFTEYLKWGSCVVSEKNIHSFRVSMPENTIKEFVKIDEAVSICKELLKNEALRNIMKQNAKKYYNENIEPSASVLGIIDDAFLTCIK